MSTFRFWEHSRKMHQDRLTKVFVKCAFCFIFLSTNAVTNGQDTRPNLIFMVADDFGWNDVGWRNPDIISPNIDSLARSGIILESSYVQPLCSPSRATFMTGYYPFRTGMQFGVIPTFGPYGLPLQFTLLPERLRDLGYSTNMVGKWHLGSCNDSYIPTNRGFDTYLGYLGGGEFHYTHSYILADNETATISAETPLVYDFWNQTNVAWDYYEIYSSIPFVAQVEYILQNRDVSRPLFMYITYQLTHSPQEVPPDFELWYPTEQNRYRRTFSAMVSALDNDVGQIMNMFRQYGVYDNSIILFTADNGAQIQDGGNNYPLRGSKNTIWEGAMRASAFIHSPLLTNTGYTYNGLVHAVDWYPTFVTLAGGTPDPALDGVNVWPAITQGTESPRTEFVYNMMMYEGNLTGALRMGDWKLIFGRAGIPNTQVLPEDVTGRYANTVGESLAILDIPDYPPFRLFNISADPTESFDVANDNPNVVSQMMARVRQYQQRMVDSLFLPDDIELYTSRTSNLSYLGTSWCQAVATVTLAANQTDA